MTDDKDIDLESAFEGQEPEDPSTLDFRPLAKATFAECTTFDQLYATIRIQGPIEDFGPTELAGIIDEIWQFVDDMIGENQYPVLSMLDDGSYKDYELVPEEKGLRDAVKRLCKARIREGPK